MTATLYPSVIFGIGFFYQLVHLGQTLQWSNSFPHHSRRGGDVVWHLLASGVPRILLWLQKTAIRASCQNQSDSKTSTNTGLVHAPCSVYNDGWYSTLWSMFH